MYSGHSLVLPLPELDGESDLHVPHQIRVFCLEIAESDTGPQHKAQYLGITEKLMIAELTQQALIVAQRILSYHQAEMKVTEVQIQQHTYSYMPEKLVAVPPVKDPVLAYTGIEEKTGHSGSREIGPDKLPVEHRHTQVHGQERHTLHIYALSLSHNITPAVRNLLSQ